MSPLRRVVLLLTTLMLLMSLCECDPPTTNDDLGSRVLAPTNSYKFSFHPDVWATTLFYRSMYWQADKKLHWFNIFEAQRDITCTDCFWSNKDTGPCRSLTQPNCSAGDKYVKCYHWNSSE
ncbi:s-protein like protein 5 [Quercus suber]|uniref:S-protein homolog n=1 Tax=Quercus suber TaxID=58331 RepID=A0AAW0LIY0_QUESU